jgi:hypothetical protein
MPSLTGLSGLSGISVCSAGAGGGGSLYDPADDPNLAFWYEADTYTTNTTPMGATYYIPRNKVNSSDDQIMIGTIEETHYVNRVTQDGVPCFHYRLQGTKTVQQYTFDDLDIHMVFKPSGTSGFTARIIDCDYGNGFWIGQGNGATLYGGGVRYGAGPYGDYASTAAWSGAGAATGACWTLLQRSRVTTQGTIRLFGSDTYAGSNGTTGIGNAATTAINPLALGSEIGGNSAYDNIKIAAVLIFRNYSVDDRNKREGWLAHHFEAVSAGMKSLLLDPSHPYFAAPPSA